MDWTANGNYGINIDYSVMASATILVAYWECIQLHQPHGRRLFNHDY